MNSRAQKQMGSNSSSLCPIRCHSDHRCCCGTLVGLELPHFFSLDIFFLSYCLFFIAKAVHIYFRNFRKYRQT